jgi:hypothetical protein
MTPGMRELYNRCVAHDGQPTIWFVKQGDKWRLTALKRRRWVETWPDDDGIIRIRVLRALPHAPARRVG